MRREVQRRVPFKRLDIVRTLGPSSAWSPTLKNLEDATVRGLRHPSTWSRQSQGVEQMSFVAAGHTVMLSSIACIAPRRSGILTLSFFHPVRDPHPPYLDDP